MRGWVLRGLATVALLAAWWPEIAAYHAAIARADAADAVAAALRGDVPPAEAAQHALALTTPRVAARPDDAGAVLPHALALLLAQRPHDAQTALQAALRTGERPELTLNLGRTRAALGDEPGAQAAFLRAAWSAPAALATLPALPRIRVQRRVLEHEAALQRGDAQAIPPLRLE